MTSLTDIAPSVERPAVAIRLREVEVTIQYWGTARMEDVYWRIDDASGVEGHTGCPYCVGRDTAREYLTQAEMLAIDRIVMEELAARADRWRWAIEERKRRKGSGIVTRGDAA